MTKSVAAWDSRAEEQLSGVGAVSGPGAGAQAICLG